MNHRNETSQLGGWHCPCLAFDYAAFELAAQRECERIQQRLEKVKSERPRTAEQELRRRRRIRMLTDMYYEQRGNLLGLAEKMAEKGSSEKVNAKAQGELAKPIGFD